jgi:DNA-binding transcriptional regulator LsrR (DeoR family)
MPVKRRLGPSEMVLATSVARRYFLHGKSKTEIADEFELSRFKVARLLETAQEQGLVRIEIGHPGNLDINLSAQLQDAFDLKQALVIDTGDAEGHELRRQLGQAAAELLSEIIGPDDVLGLAWARTVSAVATQIQRLPSIPVVQLTGALSPTIGSSSSIDDDSSIDVVREVARASRGPAHLFFAPFLVRDASTARALRRQPDVARAFSHFPSVTKALVGIGQWAPGDSTLYDAANEADRQALVREEVCADISGVFLAADGRPLKTSLTDRMLGINADQLREVEEVIAIPYGVTKKPAVLAALRSGLVNSLVTNTTLAAALLSEPTAGVNPGQRGLGVVDEEAVSAVLDDARPAR